MFEHLLEARYEFRKPRPTLAEILANPLGLTTTYQEFTENFNV